MSKTTKNDTPAEAVSGQQEQPPFMEDLGKKGYTFLSAATREELAEMIDSIPADCKYSVGAVGHRVATGTWTVRIDILKP